jgi:putative methyltransferase (TIGR04325 family)
MLSFLKKIVPWHLRQTLAHARRLHGARKPPFEGVYSSFREVASQGAWNSEEWARESLRSAEAARDLIGRTIPDTRALLPLLIAGYAAGGGTGDAALRVLDFGGGAGQDYARLRATTKPGREIHYLVVDSEACCDAGRALWRDDPAIRFSPRLPAEDERFEVILAASSIFYVEDFRDLLRTFSRFRPRLMFFSKTPSREGSSFVRAQTNMGKNLRIPHWVIGVQDLTETLQEEGYEMVYRAQDEHVYNADNYAENFRVDRTAQFVFARALDRPGTA